VKPETARNYEIGAKAEVAGGKLLLAASAFRNERNSYKVPSNDPAIPDQVLDGHSRVDGVALSVVGKITPRWSITGNYTYLDAKLIQSVADGLPDPASGAQLQNTPKHSGSLFTTYEFPFGLTLGYSVTYQGSFALNLPTATSADVFRSKDYLVHSAYVAYALTEKLKAQLNVKNIGDELYFTRIRNNGWATPGDGRAAIFSLNYTY
jgi:catecholate siderophore receptor